MTRLDVYCDRLCMAACFVGVSYILVWHILF